MGKSDDNTAAQASVVAPQQSQSKAEQVSVVVEEWFHEQVRNGPIARETMSYNAAVDAKEVLKRMLVERLFG